MDESNQLTFLLADGELVNLDEQAALLQEMGYTNVLQAEDGSEAWAIIQNFDVEFVISNLKLPEISGLDLLKIVRSNRDFGVVPFVLMASEVTAKLVAKAGRTGVNDIIVLPCPDDVFKKKIEAVFEVEKRPENQEAQQSYDKGVDLMKAGQWDEALQSFKNTLAVHESAEVFFNMGFIKAAKGELEEALRYFQQATRINSDFARAFKQMGQVFSQLGRKDEAERCLEQAASIYLDRKNDREAEDILHMLKEIKPDTKNVYNSLGIIYRRQNRWAEAAEQYRKALKVHPRDDHIYYNLARVYMELKEFSRATEVLSQALDINPNFGPAQELLKAAELGLNLGG